MLTPILCPVPCCACEFLCICERRVYYGTLDSSDKRRSSGVTFFKNFFLNKLIQFVII